MGRAMLIIVSGVLLSVGITQSGLQDTVLGLSRHSTGYAERTQSSNIAHSALELTIHQMMQDETVCTQDGSLTYALDEGTAIVQFIYCADPADEDDVTYRLRATGTVGDQEQSINVTYQLQELHFLPDFNGAIGIATDDFTFGIDGASASISGNDASMTCEDGPGVAVQSAEGEDKVEGYASQIDGDPAIEVDPALNFDDVTEMIQRLEEQPGAQFLGGNVNEPLGSADNPGVFFVTSSTQLKGGASEGYGILVIRTNGELEMEGELDLGGNFTFNGLVIFENAFSLSAKGTPSINGSMLIGNTNDIGTMDVGISGNVNIQYDCQAIEYAKKASANVNGAGRKYTATSIYE
ncbi:MAG: hypothetical protein WDZ29_00635 [Balneolaceae bacterium]